MDGADEYNHEGIEVVLSPFDNSYGAWSHIIKSIESHDYLEIARTRVRAMKRGPVTLDSERAKNILPLSRNFPFSPFSFLPLMFIYLILNITSPFSP